MGDRLRWAIVRWAERVLANATARLVNEIEVVHRCVVAGQEALDPGDPT